MFEQSIERKEDGYCVTFHEKKNASLIPNNRGLAVRRLQALITKLNEETYVLRNYEETLQNQLTQGIRKEIDENEIPTGAKSLPHRAFITTHKSTAKLRIVFDASAQLKDSPSLNDVLLRGPELFSKLCDILLRFRIRNIALVSDVEKAFLQVRLHMQGRDAPRFSWLR